MFATRGWMFARDQPPDSSVGDNSANLQKTGFRQREGGAWQEKEWMLWAGTVVVRTI